MPSLRLRLLITLSFIAVAVIVSAWRSSPVSITLENLRHIRIGMTRAEVEQLLGGPAGDYRTNARVTHDHGGDAIVFPRGVEMDAKDLPVHVSERWIGNEWLIVVAFDAADKVKLAYGLPAMQRSR